MAPDISGCTFTLPREEVWREAASNITSPWISVQASASTSGAAFYVDGTSATDNTRWFFTNSNGVLGGGRWEIGTVYEIDITQATRSSPYVQEPLTPEETEARQERRRRAAHANHIVRCQQAKARWYQDHNRKRVRRRAKQLLMDNLTLEQREEFSEHEYFTVVSQSGRRFHITKGLSHNIYELSEGGERICTFCIHPRDMPAVWDVMLQQLILLRFDEEHFMRIANRSSYPRFGRRADIRAQSLQDVRARYTLAGEEAA